MTNTFENYSIVEGENNNTAPSGMKEGIQAGLVNDSWRRGKAYERRTWASNAGEDGGGNDRVSGGTGGNYTLTITDDYAAYHPGMNLTFRANHENTGVCTLTVTTPSATLAQVPMTDAAGNALKAGQIKAGMWINVKYDKTNARFHVLGGNTDAATVSDVQIGRHIYLTGIGGTGDAVTATADPTLTKYTEGQQVRLKAVADNTGAVTLDIDGVGVANVKTPTGGDIPAGGWFTGRMITLVYDGSTFIDDLAVTAELSNRGHIQGLVPSNAADADHDITFSAGQLTALDADSNWSITTALTKRGDAAFAEGNNEGGLGNGVTLPADGIVYFYAITKSAGGTADIYIDTSNTGANVPSGWVVERRIWKTRTNSANNFHQITAYETAGGGLYVEYKSKNPVGLDFNTSSLSTTPQTFSVAAPPNVTVKLRTYAIGAGGSINCLIYPETVNDEAVSYTAPPLGNSLGQSLNDAGQGEIELESGSNAQVKTVAFAASTTLRVHTVGWTDHRRD